VLNLKEGNLTARMWDAEKFSTLEGVSVSVRVVHSEEKELKRKRRGDKWAVEVEEHNWWWATTSMAPAFT